MRVLQRGDALLDRRVGAEQLADAAGDAHGLQALGQFGRVHAAQAGQCVDHRLPAAHEAGGTRIGAELALAAEPGHDHRGQETQHDVEHDGGDHVADAGAGVVLVVAAQEAVHRVADHAREEHDEGVHHALDQGHGDHVAVGDVGHLVADHGLDLLAGHALQQAGGDRHEGIVLEGAGGEGVRVALEDADLGHADAGLVGELAHGLDDPGLVGRARAVDHAHAGTPLGDRLADEQRDDRAAEAHDEGEAEQRPQVEAVGRQVAVDAEQAGDDAQHHHDGKVGEQK